MRPIENTEEFVREGKPHVRTGPQMDKRVLDDSFTAMEETLGANKLSSRRIIFLSRAARFAAAAAVIIVAISLFVVHQGPDEQKQKNAPKIAESPAEMLSLMSLNIAYSRGGIEAVDARTEKAFEMLGSQSAKVSIQELLEEYNGV
jgi:hypothetical protein